ncbi:MAG: hypothetical protein CL398_01805 [Acidiferrobacteraceae bacterium]|nr:hypothetical protein [Acidiferrobacteraceae bacterium]|tara:strand:- start:2134 stop:3078 length:945 start_codon:yes stop_codon:yes gene_type:complete
MLSHKGPVYSIITLFNENGSINFSGISEMIVKAHEGGHRCFYFMAFNGRVNLLTYKELHDYNKWLINLVKDLSSDSLVIVPGPIAASAMEIACFATEAHELGADCYSVYIGERYYSDEQLTHYFDYLVNHSPAKWLVHQMPLPSGYGGAPVNWPLKTLEQITQHDNVIALKEDSKDKDYTDQVLRVVADNVTIILSGGGKRQWLGHNQVSQCWLTALGVVYPEISTRFYSEVGGQENTTISQIAKDIVRAESIFLDEIVGRFSWHLGVRSVILHRFGFNAFERSPMYALGNDAHRDIAKIIEDKIEPLIRPYLL